MTHLDQIVWILIWCIGLCVVLGVGAALADWLSAYIDTTKESNNGQ